MNNKVFFDTTILIYSVSEGDSRSDVAEELLAAGGTISVQVLNEFAAVGRRKLKMSWQEIGEALDAIRALCEPPVPLTVEMHDAALKIAGRFGFNVYDTLIVAAALGAGCDRLYSEDMQDGQKIKSLTIRNPFAGR
ncbi:MAG: PIN domain-containing protein [Acidobacteriaceae bacterium]